MRGRHKDAGDGKGVIDIDENDDRPGPSRLNSTATTTTGTDPDSDEEAEDTAEEAYIVSDDDSSGLVDLGVGHQSAVHPPSTVRHVMAKFKVRGRLYVLRDAHASV